MVLGAERQAAGAVGDSSYRPARPRRPPIRCRRCEAGNRPSPGGHVWRPSSKVLVACRGIHSMPDASFLVPKVLGREPKHRCRPTGNARQLGCRRPMAKSRFWVGHALARLTEMEAWLSPVARRPWPPSSDEPSCRPATWTALGTPARPATRPANWRGLVSKPFRLRFA
jgi:hypothetical protein